VEEEEESDDDGGWRWGEEPPRRSPPRGGYGDDPDGGAALARRRSARSDGDVARAPDAQRPTDARERFRLETFAGVAPVADGANVGLGGARRGGGGGATPSTTLVADGMPVRVFAGTWNVNGKRPSADVRPWLRAAGGAVATGAAAASGERRRGRDVDGAAPSQLHDVYLIALQEVQPLSGRTAITTDADRGREWEDHFRAALGRDRVTRVASRQLVGIQLLVFATYALAPAISDVMVTDAGVGLMRAAGNKGAVAARFVLYGTTSVAAVSCHLAAHDHAMERRNEDFRQLLRQAVFSEAGVHDNSDWNTLVNAVNSGVTKAKSKVRAAGAAYSASGGVSSRGGGAYAPGIRLTDADALFWLGDLNYRIDLPAAEVLALIRARDWPALRAADQLSVSKARGDVFRGFTEGVLDFAPTYKHASYGDGYELHEDGEVKRTPAWCDRILWHTRGQQVATLHAYRRHEVRSSDHRPVSATFTLLARVPPDRWGGRAPRSAPPPRTAAARPRPPPQRNQPLTVEASTVAPVRPRSRSRLRSRSRSRPRSRSRSRSPPPTVAAAAHTASAPAGREVQLWRDAAAGRGGAAPPVPRAWVGSGVAAAPPARGGPGSGSRGGSGRDGSPPPLAGGVSVSPQRLQLGRVRYGVPASGSVRVANGARRPVTVRLAAADVPPWLRLARDGVPLFGAPTPDRSVALQLPADGGLRLSVTALVDGDCGEVAASLGRGAAPLRASLPLRPVGGGGGGAAAPPAVLVEGDYRRTALGSSPAALAAAASRSVRGGPPLPPAVKRLCDALVTSAAAAQPRPTRAGVTLDMVATALRLPPTWPPPPAVVALLDAVDDGSPFRSGGGGGGGGGDGVDVAAAAGALYTLVASFRPPLLPAAAGHGPAASSTFHLVLSAARRVGVDMARAAAPGDMDAELLALRSTAEAWVDAFTGSTGGRCGGGGQPGGGGRAERRRAVASIMEVLHSSLPGGGAGRP